MARYRKKPVEIEAVQVPDVAAAWQEGREAGLAARRQMEAIVDWTGEAAQIVDDAVDGVCLIIATLEGDMKARAGDYVIRGIKGEFYPCKPDVFAATYEEVAG